MTLVRRVRIFHMNGRVYDPLLGRFGTPDPMTENPFSTQGWNRYSYVGNSPVNFTDPSGYCFLGCFWKPIFRAIGNFFRQSWRAILNITVTGLCHLATGPNPGCAALGSFVAGITSGNLGQALRGAALAFVTAAVFQGVGKMTAGNLVAKVVAHAGVGCLSSMASGGPCGAGALAAAVSAAGTPFIDEAFPHPLTNMDHFIGGTTASALLGGVGSVAAGGNFANGAVTAAYGYLFNYLTTCRYNPNCSVQQTEMGGAGSGYGGIGPGPAWGRAIALWFSSLLGGDTRPDDPYRTIYRAIGPTELAHLRATGNYGFTQNASGKYFALTLNGVYDFADSSFNRGRDMTITSTSVPQSVLQSGFDFNDPGGAGPSVHFSDPQLPNVYSRMTPVQILPRTRGQ